jgi:ubiquinone/menaquinone biosynthesis C-methylase UbiE
MLARAGERLGQQPGAVLLHADAEHLPVRSAACDGYVSNNVLYCVNDPKAMLLEAARVTEPGGVLSLASTRPSLDVEVLLAELYCYLDDHPETAVHEDDLTRFTAANKALQTHNKNAYEPDEMARLLDPHWRVLDADVTYLDQLFYVRAERRDCPP